jgi:hypothetical protein
MSEQNVNPPDEEPISPEGADDEAPIVLEGDGDEPISLVEPSEGAGGPSKLRTIGAAVAAHRAEFKRPLNLNGTGATRCRMFRAKMAIASLEALETQINEWLDADEIEVKHVSQVIGTVQGKTAELSLIVTVWY